MNRQPKTMPTTANMKLYGTLAANLDAAIISARRFRRQKVYSETLRYWADLVELARQTLPADALANGHPIAVSADHLERELKDRGEDCGTSG
jgi:hypothetical protein